MSIVYLSETCNRKVFTNRILEIFKEPVGKAKKIFVKPNIVSSEPYPTTTHPEVLDTLLSRLSDREVLVGDGPAVDAGRSRKILNVTPLRKVCDHHGVRLVNFYSEKMKKLTSERGYKIKISTLPLVCDFVISLPVLKVHSICGLSGALKNQFGYLSRQDRVLMHCGIKNLQKGIAEVNAAVPTNLFIVDAVDTLIKAQERRHGGCPAELGVMIAGTDPVSLDCFGLELLRKLEPGFKAKKKEGIRYINYAAEYGVGNTDFQIHKI